MKGRCFIITLISFKLDYKPLRDFAVTAHPNFNDHTLITKDSSDGPPINTTVSNLNPIFPSVWTTRQMLSHTQAMDELENILNGIIGNRLDKLANGCVKTMLRTLIKDQN